MDSCSINSCKGAVTVINNQLTIDYLRISVVIGLLIISQVMLQKNLIKHRKKIQLTSLIILGLIIPTCTCNFVIIQSLISFFTNNITTTTISITIIGAIIMTSTLLFGRTYCGWVCPLGAAQELINKKELINKETRNKMRMLSYSILIIVIYLTINGVIIYGPTININKFINSIILTTTLITLLISIITYRPWCNLCPFGALLSLINKVSLNKIKANECNNCNTCNEYCKSNAIINGKTTINCINCGDCINHCPIKSLKVSNFLKRKNTKD